MFCLTSAIHEGCDAFPSGKASFDDVLVFLGEVDEENAESPNIDANIDVDLSSAESAALDATADPASVPKALMPTRALFRRSSAISFFLFCVFLRITDIFSETMPLPSLRLSSRVCCAAMHSVS